MTARPGPARRPPAGLLAVQRAADRARDALDAPVPHALTAALQRLARDRDVVERLLAPARELLALLVALAGDHDDVARPREPDRAGDRGAAVDLALDVAAARARGDLLDDRLRVLRARVVGGHDRQVGEPRGDLPHQRALAAVAVAARAEDDDHAPLGDGARRHAARSRARPACASSRPPPRTAGPRRPARSGPARAAAPPSVASSGSGAAPSTRAAAHAPSALSTLKRPGIPSRTGHSPSPVRSVKSEPAASGRTSSARTSASSSIPNVTRAGELGGQPPPVRVVDAGDPHARIDLEQPPLGEEVATPCRDGSRGGPG